MILDVALILIVALFIFIGYKRGIIKSLYGLISLAVAGFGANFLSNYLSKWIYDIFFAEGINASINASLTGVTATTEDVFSNLPGYVTGLLGFFGVNDSGVFDVTQSAQLIEAELQNSVMTAVVSVIKVILVVVLFILIFIAMKLLSRTFKAIFNLPVIKQINGLFGMAFGLAEGLVICYIAVLLCRLFLFTSNQTVIDADIINNSLLFSRIYYSDFITYIAT